MYRALKCAVAFGGLLALSACGGGGGSQVETTPPPPPAPSAFPLNASQTFETSAVTRSTSGSGNALTRTTTLAWRPSGLTISYDAAAGTYRVSDSAGSATFGSADRSTSGFQDVYTKQSNSVTDELRLFANARAGGSQSGAPLQFTYLTFGTWTHTDSATGAVRKSHMIFGYPTATSSMPVSGSASYQTTVSASMFEGGPSYPNTQTEIEGTATFTANFGTGAINTQLSLNRPMGGSSLGVFAGTGTIQSGTNQFSGAFAGSSTSAGSTSGSFAGGFFGPSAAEMGYNFGIQKFIADPFAGASVLPMHTILTGTVVGKKQ